MSDCMRRCSAGLMALMMAACVLLAPVAAKEESEQDSDIPVKSATGAPEEEEPLDAEAFVKRVIAATNAARKDEGLPELKVMDELTDAAKLRAAELEKNYSHTRPDGEKWSTIFKELGLKSKARAENIAWGYRSPEAVANAWLDSPGHRKNIMNEKYNYIAVAIHVTAAGEYTWEQLLCK